MIEELKNKLVTKPTKKLRKIIKSGEQVPSDFYETILHPVNLDPSEFYYPIDSQFYTEGRSSSRAIEISKRFSKYPWYQGGYSYFMNAIRPGDERPKFRHKLSPYIFGTVEIDKPFINDCSIESLSEQLEWCTPYPSNRPMNCKLGELHNFLCQFYDYRGSVAVWSGNKSIHYHFIFSLEHLSAEQSQQANRSKGKFITEPNDRYLESIHMKLYATLEDYFRKFVSIGHTVTFDDRMKEYNRWRRLPYGTRIFDGYKGSPTENIFGDKKAVQFPVWEMILGRQPNCPKDFEEEERSFLLDRAFVYDAIENHTIKNRTYKKTNKLGDGDFELPDAILDELTEITYAKWGEFPKPARLVIEGGLLKLYLYRDLNDKNPSGVIIGSNSSVYMDGKRLEHCDLGFSLEDFVFSRIDDVKDIKLNKTELIFRESTKGKSNDEKRQMQNRLLPRLTTNRLTCIMGNQGSGKSYSYMKNARGSNSGLWVFSCLSYEQAEAQCETFNRMHNDKKGKVVKTFSRLYQELGGELTHLDAMTHGYPTLIHLVRACEPEIYNKCLENRTPISANDYIFTVHQAAMNWNENSISKIWLSDKFKDEMLDTPEYGDIPNTLHISALAIDEFAYSDFYDVFTYDEGRCIKSLSKHKEWAEAKSTAEKYAFFCSYNKYYTYGVSFDKIQNVIIPRKQEPITVKKDFDNFSRINDIMYNEKDKDDIDIRYFVVPKRWFHKMGNTKITLLTTEIAPTLIAEKLGFHTYKLLPDMNPTVIPIVTCQDITAKKTHEHMEHYHSINPNIVFVGNFTNNHDFITGYSHQTAKGMNGLSGNDIISYYHWMNYKQYHVMNVLGQYLGMNDIIRLHYLDNMYQAIGRNQGFRNEGKKHVIVMRSDLYALLNPCTYNPFGYALTLTTERQLESYMKENA
ncbi:hypothetical protein ABIE65_002032 [Constrictibacter sp. MBR-5]|uniref:hypothetical protein n=1 Tax=Constrictibacter sp. MBR-5 TaxID=3156467 RepID=UPI00339459DE